MTLRLCIASTLTVFLVISTFAQEKADTAKSPAKEATSATYAELLTQWNDLNEKVDDAQGNLLVAIGDDIEKAKEKYTMLIAEMSELLPNLREAGISEYKETPNKDKKLTRMLVGMVANDIRGDHYVDALSLAELLIENKCEIKPVYNLAGIAAFSSQHFDKAKTFLEQAKEDGTLGAFGGHGLGNVESYLDEAEEYEKLWQKEQEIRKKEEEADDLPRVKLTTTKGDIVVELFENEAPQTVANFISLVEEEFYNGLSFHRVLPGFMAQGGCPKGDGSGDPGYEIYCECKKEPYRKHFRGALSMANAGPDTGGSQFFLTFRPTPNLNGGHTVFGRVIAGMDVLEALQRRDPSAVNKPKPDEIVTAEVFRKREHEYKPTKVEAKSESKKSQDEKAESKEP